MKAGVMSGIAVLGLVLSAASGAALAQTATTTVPDHPRVNEVNQRLDNQQQRIDNGVSQGTIGAKQAAADEKHDANIAKRESVDEAKNGGHLTMGEKHRLNRSLNRDSRHIKRQRQ